MAKKKSNARRTTPAKSEPVVKRFKPDWTCDATGRSNCSPEFQFIMSEIQGIILNGAYDLLHGNSLGVARVIAARLSHTYGFTTKLKLADMQSA